MRIYALSCLTNKSNVVDTIFVLLGNVETVRIWELLASSKECKEYTREINSSVNIIVRHPASFNQNKPNLQNRLSLVHTD